MKGTTKISTAFSLFLIFTIILGLIGPIHNNSCINAHDSNIEINTNSGIDYLGMFSFTTDSHGGDPVGWSVSEFSTCTIDVINEKEGHAKVLEVHDDMPNAQTEAGDLFYKPFKRGAIEFYIYGTKGSVSQDSIFVTIEDIFIIPNDHLQFQFDYFSEKIKVLDSSSVWQNVCNLTENRWNHIKVSFECDTGGYDGLAADSCNIYVNGTKYGPFEFWAEVEWMYYLEFSTNKTETDGGFYAWIDAVDYSWASGYYDGRNLDFETPIDYFGLYSFTDDTSGANPLNWSINEPSNTNLEVIEHKVGHSKVVQFQDNSAIAAAEMINNFTSPQSNGAIEMWIYGIQGSTWEDFLHIEIGNGSGMNLRLYFDVSSGLIRVLNSTGGWEYGPSGYRNRWFHIKVTFECGGGGYDGLAADTCNIYRNDVKFGPFEFWAECSTVTQLKIGTNDTDADGDFYAWIDAVDYSWAPGYYDGRNKDYASSPPIPGYTLLFVLIGIFGVIGAAKRTPGVLKLLAPKKISNN